MCFLVELFFLVDSYMKVALSYFTFDLVQIRLQIRFALQVIFLIVFLSNSFFNQRDGFHFVRKSWAASKLST